MSDIDKLCPIDLVHLGMLCRRIREAHGVSLSTIATQCGVKPETIDKFEQETGSTRQKTFEQYVKALSSKDITHLHDPISDDHANMLLSLYARYNARSKDKLQRHLCNLAALSFTHILPGRRNPQLDALVGVLAKEKRPALIMDDLWFIHAVNGTLLRLFDVKPDDPMFNKWDGWHGLANKARKSSPVRRGHVDTDKIIPPTNAYFFEDGRTYPHLFSPQMRHLVCELITLSKQEDFDFHKWWLQATEFTLPFERASQPRVIISGGQHITVYPSIVPQPDVTLDNGYAVNYALGVWDHDGSPTGRAAFAAAHSGKRVSLEDVLYAADYDTNHNLHVNTWPVVKKEIETWECS